MISKIKKFARKNPYKVAIIICITVVVIILAIILPIILTKSSGNNNSAGNSGGGQKPSTPTLPPTPTPTPPPPPPTPTPPPPPPLPTEGIIGAWAGTIGCGDGAFNIISLGSALPQNYNTAGLNAFFGTVEGNYNSNLSSGKTKYIISVGGSNASTTGWNTFLSQITSDLKNIQNFYNGCKCRGIVGIDFDLEGTDYTMVPYIINLVNQLKSIDKNFIVMYTILLGTPTSFADLLNTTNYDYLSLMLYNGGMYIANISGAGCDWDGWAELILSKGKTGCKYPKNAECITNPQQSQCSTSLSNYVQLANLSAINPSKVLLGLIIDTEAKKLDPSILARANQLNKQYGGAGIMIWVIPGWKNKNSITELNAMGFNIDASKCSSGKCPPPKNPCSNGMTAKCIASTCGKSSEGVTDSQCAPCASGQTYWPCGDSNFCEADSGIPSPTCF